VNRWSLTPSGVGLVAKLELRQRIRSSRWVIMLVLWFALIALITGLAFFAMGSQRSGPLLFSVVVFLVLTLGLLVAPALGATSVNGDRAAGTLATLQVTLLSPAEIAVGKLLAAWTTALVFLATASPFLALALLLGRTSVLRVVVSLLMLALILLAVCGIAIGWSAVCARTASSAVLTYLSVAGLAVFTLVFFGLSVPLVMTTDRVTVLQNPPGLDSAVLEPDEPGQEQLPIDRSRCVETTAEREQVHTEWTWWLLAANPYVVVADAAPRLPKPQSGDGVAPVTGSDEDVLSLIQSGARAARDGASGVVDECWAAYAATSSGLPEAKNTSPIWPYGLVIILGLGGVGMTGAVRRLSTPVQRLSRGTRIA
jgi:ABC-type transport system involved in multi-copper enzyme maturation permease subunit